MLRSLPAQNVGLLPLCGRLQATKQRRGGAPRSMPESESRGFPAHPRPEIDAALNGCWRTSDHGHSEAASYSSLGREMASPRRAFRLFCGQESVLKIERNSRLIEMRFLIRLDGVRTNVQNGVVLSAFIPRRARLGDETAFLQQRSDQVDLRPMSANQPGEGPRGRRFAAPMFRQNERYERQLFVAGGACIAFESRFDDGPREQLNGRAGIEVSIGRGFDRPRRQAPIDCRYGKIEEIGDHDRQTFVLFDSHFDDAIMKGNGDHRPRFSEPTDLHSLTAPRRLGHTTIARRLLTARYKDARRRRRPIVQL
jgi:hypothetical protein